MAIALAHRVYDASVPLVILHGLFGSAVNWNSIARKFSRDRPVYTVDLRNHGQSPHTDSMDYPEMARDVLALLDGLGIASAVLVGHSMGGKVAMVTALENPRRVNRLVVVDIAPVAYEHEFDTILDAMQRVQLPTLQSREQADAVLAQSVPEAPMRSFILQNLRRENGGWCWRINIEAIRRSIPALVGFPEEHLAGRHYDGDTLFLGGSHSTYIRRAYRPLIHQYFPRAQLQKLEGVGHWLHAEQPGEFVIRVQSFLGPGGTSAVT
jgi:pimeloyl-ACP methyl ester carboxylesterase